MNRSMRKMWIKSSQTKKNSMQELRERFPYAQNIRWLAAKKNRFKNILDAAHSCYWWPAFSSFFDDSDSSKNDKKSKKKKNRQAKFTIDSIKWNPSAKNLKTSGKEKSKIIAIRDSRLGEYVSDTFDNMEPSVEKDSSILDTVIPSSDSVNKKNSSSKNNITNPKINVRRKSKTPRSSTAAKVQRKTNKALVSKNWHEWESKKTSSNNLSDFTKWINSYKQNESEKIKSEEHIESKASTPKKSSTNITDKNQKKNKAKGIKNKESKKKKRNSLKNKIKSSVQINESIISESLANLLAEQGHLEDAIQMYERLSLIFPEKNSFFAVKIKALKNK